MRDRQLLLLLAEIYLACRCPFPEKSATLIIRFKTRARDYMATAERNAYQLRVGLGVLIIGVVFSFI